MTLICMAPSDTPPQPAYYLVEAIAIYVSNGSGNNYSVKVYDWLGLVRAL